MHGGYGNTESWGICVQFRAISYLAIYACHPLIAPSPRSRTRECQVCNQTNVTKILNKLEFVLTYSKPRYHNRKFLFLNDMSKVVVKRYVSFTGKIIL